MFNVTCSAHQFLHSDDCLQLQIYWLDLEIFHIFYLFLMHSLFEILFLTVIFFHTCRLEAYLEYLVA